MRLSVPLPIADISAFSRSLEAELQAAGQLPGHLELLNMLARAGGYGNFQHLRASMKAEARITPARPPVPPVDFDLVAKTANAFDAEGRLLRWPTREAQQTLALWVLWSRFPAGRELSEAGIGELLKQWHAFGDHALLRRALFDWKLVDRTVDGRVYRRIEQPPPPELGPLLRRLAAPEPAPAAEAG